MPAEWDPLEAATRRFNSDDLKPEVQRLDDLERLPEKFWGNVRPRAQRRFGPFANRLADGKVLRRVAQQVANEFRLLLTPLVKSTAAERIARLKSEWAQPDSEIEGLGKRFGIEPKRVSAWIAEGKPIADVSREILDGMPKPKPLSLPSSEQRDEMDRKFFEQQYRRNSPEQTDHDREVLRQLGFRSAKPITTGAAAELEPEVDLSEKEQPEEKLDRKISDEAAYGAATRTTVEMETPAPQTARKNADDYYEQKLTELADEAATRTTEFKQWFESELQRIVDDAMEIAGQKAAAEAAAQQQVLAIEKPATEVSPPAEQTDQVKKPAPDDLAGEPASRGSFDGGDVIAAAETPGNPVEVPCVREVATPKTAAGVESPAESSAGGEQADLERRLWSIWCKVQANTNVNQAQARTLYGCSRGTLQNWLNDGKLKRGTLRGSVTAASIRENPPDKIPVPPIETS